MWEHRIKECFTILGWPFRHVEGEKNANEGIMIENGSQWWRIGREQAHSQVLRREGCLLRRSVVVLGEMNCLSTL